MAPKPARRWSSHQPNVTGRGIVAAYSARFWTLVVVLGVATGAGAALLMALLSLAEHLAYGGHASSFLGATKAASGERRVLVLCAAGLLVGLGAILLPRLPGSGSTEVSDALWLHGGRMALVPSFGRAVLSVVTVGMGVSLGREAAPQLAGAAVASRLSDWAGLPLWQRRLLVASGAGARFAAVYNVPLGGALFALEVLLGTLALPLVLPALAVSAVATAVAWITLGTGPTYHMASVAVNPSELVWAVVLGPVLGVAAVAWVKLIERVNRVRLGPTARVTAPLLVLGLLGLVSIRYPLLLGNGKAIVQLALVGELSLGMFAVLLVLKPIATAACLGVGAPGGLFTPTLSVGVLLTGLLTSGWSQIWSVSVPAAYVLIGGGAFLAASMQGPLSGVVLVLELTRHFDPLMVPTLVAVTEATIVARRLRPCCSSSRALPSGMPSSIPV
ncbi:MAG: chloride channel protein [Actinomycetota bacterium]|nr:chloride channel protein [Actinomycetota bacterium]